MASVNRVVLMGYLGGDVELRYDSRGVARAEFSLATSETIKDKTYTEWHNIVVWAKQGENAKKYLHKGSGVHIIGKLQYLSWEKDGQKHYKTIITAETVQYLPKGQQQTEHAVGNYDSYNGDYSPF